MGNNRPGFYVIVDTTLWPSVLSAKQGTLFFCLTNRFRRGPLDQTLGWWHEDPLRAHRPDLVCPKKARFYGKSSKFLL